MIKGKRLCSVILGVLLLSIAFPFISIVSANSVLGNDGVVVSGSPTYNTSDMLYLFGPFTASTTGYINEVKTYVYVGGYNSIIAGGIYSDASGSPNALLANGPTVSVSSTGWASLPLSSSYQVTANSKYWLAILFKGAFGGPLQIGYQSTGGATTLRSISAGSFINPATGGSTTNNVQVSIYSTVLSDPFYSSNLNAYAQIGSATTFSAKWNTNETLSHWIIQTNQTGTPTNSSWQAFAGSTYSNYTGSVLPLNNSLVGAKIAYKIWANTTLGLWADTGLQYTTILDATYGYVFNGVYDENTGSVIGGCNVTANFDDGTPAYSFIVNNTYSYYPNSQPLYFEYNIQSYANTTDPTITRQYWLKPTETNGNYNIFGDQIGLAHIIFQIRALGGIGLSSFLAVQRIINGTYQTVEQRQVDVTGIATMSLQPYTIYRVVAWSGDTSTTFGNINTYTSPIILTISALSFPSTVLSQYKYVHIYASRPDSTTIQVSYEDTDSQTLSVAYIIKNSLGVTVYSNTHTNENSFIDVWLGASANTTYYLEATVTQSRFGVSTFNAPLFGANAQTSPINLDIFGDFGNIDSAQIIWIIIILAVFLCFSALNSWLGALCGVGVAAIFTYLGWLHISQSIIVTAFGFVILAAIAAWKHRST